jgi:hypothetical protein
MVGRGWSRRVTLILSAAAIVDGAACTYLTGVDDLNEAPCTPGHCDAAARDVGVDVTVEHLPKDAAPKLDIVHEIPADAAPPPDADADAMTSYATTILEDTPIAYWRLNETSGSVAHDSSGHGNDATYFDCTLDAPGALLDESETAASFNGSTSYVSGPNFAFAGSASFSIEAWANATEIDSGSYHHILTDETQSGNRQGYALFLTSAAEVGFERFVDSSNDIAFGPTLKTGMFHHVAGTYDGATLTLYFDGVSVGTASDARLGTGTTDPFYVGAAESVKFFGGVIGEVAIYDHALSAPRVAAHYHASGR